MNGHDEIRRLLPLAASGALSGPEQRRVDQHAASCEQCARELGGWQALTGALGRLPTPVAPAGLVERTRLLVEREAAATRKSRAEAWVLIAVTVLSWAFAGSVWVVLEALGYGMATERIILWSVAWTALSTLASGTAAAMLAARNRAWRSL